jgi:hypothetical protein
MIPRSCVIRALPALAISPVRLLPIPGGPWLARGRCRGGGWRGGAAGAGWHGRRGAEPLADERGRGLVVPGRGAAGPGMTLFPFTGREGAALPAAAATAAGTRRRGG